MDISGRLRDLSRNLFWTWHPEVVEVFRDLEPELWRKTNHNPVEFLTKIKEDDIKARSLNLALESRITYAFHVLRDYLQTDDTWGRRNAGPLRNKPVAYFSAEFGLHESLPIYSGGLGVLAGDHLKAASDLDVPLVGVGLFYARGYFHQRLDKNGWQMEEYRTSDLNILPLEPVMGSDGKPLRIRVGTRTAPDIWVGAWTAWVGRSRLILLDTNVDGNNDEVRDLTSQLYGGDDRFRIRQELVLGVGGMRMLKAMGIAPGVIHMNEGHSAFAVLELARQLMFRDGQPFQNVQERTASVTVFTTHTPVAAGHDRFNPGLVEETMGPLRNEIGLSEFDFMALGRVNPHDSNETFCMTVLGLRMSRARNAVSHLHASVSRSMWKELWPGRPEHEVPIGYITNGVHVGTWVASQMDRLYRRCLGGHMAGTDDPLSWTSIEEVDDEEFWEQDQILKTHLIEFVRRRINRQCVRRGEECEPERILDPDALTIGFARRFAMYKRGDLLMRDLDRLDRLVNNSKMPVQIIYAGKAHPADDRGKQVIQRIFEVTNNPRFKGRVVFLEDYDINVARHLVQGVDLWLNTPRRPLEACGTSGLKAMLNAGLNLSVLDGWWAEAYDGTNGFAVGDGGEHSDWNHQDQIDMELVYQALENEVVPLFYNRCEGGIPREWIACQKRALKTLAWRFTAHRMVRDYTMGCYLPAVGGLTSSLTAASHRK